MAERDAPEAGGGAEDASAERGAPDGKTPEAPEAPGMPATRGTPHAEGPELVLRPSLLAALDVTAKIMAAVTAVLLPVVVPALLRGDAVSAAAIFFGVQALDLYPAIAVALFPAVQLAFTRYTVDEEGIRVNVQILSRSERRVPWEKVTALRHRRTFIDALLGIERLDVVAYGTRGTTVKLVGLREAASLRDRIAGRMRDSAHLDSWLRSD